MKIKFNSDNDLSLKKPLKFRGMTIVIRSVFEKGDKLYPEVFLNDALYEFMYVKMLKYEKIGISEGIDTNKKSPSKECMLCHYWYFKDVGFKFEPHVCNKCHDDYL